MGNNMNIRYTAPTRYDKGEFGSMCKVINENDSISYYIQTSKDDEHANWLKTTDIIAHAFEHYAQIPQFISCCLEIIGSKFPNNAELFKDLIDIILVHIPKHK